jgi:hypothetical protein
VAGVAAKAVAGLSVNADLAARQHESVARAQPSHRLLTKQLATCVPGPFCSACCFFETTVSSRVMVVLNGLRLDWQWAGGSSPSTVVKPLVVLLPWVWSQPQFVNKYTQICHQVSIAPG